LKRRIITSILLISAVVCMNGCGGSSNTSAINNTKVENETTVTESEVTETTSTESEVTETQVSESTEELHHVTADTPFEFEEAEEIYCQYETLETPVTVYALSDGDIYGDPNYCNNTLMPQSSYSAGEEITFKMKTVYDGVEYYANKWSNGLIIIAPVSNFSDTPVEVDDTAEQYYEDLPDMGGMVTEDTPISFDASSWEASLNGEGWTQEQLDMVDGVKLY